ncbi:hypothetical protein V8E55_007425 [Tylopilus felleus]
MVLPQTLPQFPEHELLPPNLITAANVLSDIYHHAFRVLDQDQTDPLQVKIHLAAIEHDAIPLLLAIEQDNHSMDMNEWLVTTTTQFGTLFVSLSRYGNDIQNQTDHNVCIPRPIIVAHTGQRGCPRKTIDLAYLKEVLTTCRNIKLTELARVLGIHRNTLRAYMKKHGIKRTYSTLSNEELDQLVRQFKVKRPESGLTYAMGHLRAQGHRVQYRRVLQSLRRVDRIGQVLRNRQLKRRHKYYIKRPNALWHIDGHHKLIRWGIVIHGMIDGFCRMVSS